MKRNMSVLNLAMILCAALPLSSGTAAYAGTPVKTNVHGTVDISVMSFDIDRYDKAETEHKWEDRVHAVVAMIEDECPAVIGMQECMSNQKDDLDLLLQGYDSFGAGILDGKLKGPMNAVYYRKDCLDLVDYGYFWYSDTPDEPRTKFESAEHTCGASWAVFSIRKTGRKFFFLNTALDIVAEVRGMQARMILEMMDEYGKGLPCIVVGDFHYKEAGTFGTDMNNPSVVLNTRMVDGRRMSLCTSSVKSANFYGKKKNGNRDYIFYTPDLEGILFKTINKEYAGVKYMSDHYPVRNVIRFRK